MNPLNNYRGQVAVFYALLVPVFLFLGGVGLDLGWYYLNVSRLQNAADAAVLAGANKLIETHTSSSENYKAKLVDKFPADKPETTISTTAGNDEALDYAKKNLESDSTAYAPPSFFSVAQAEPYELKDSYTRGNNTVKMTPSLYKDDEDNYYYVLHLTENIHHFFIGFLDDMEAPVVAVALISKNIDGGGGGDPPPEVLTDKKIILDSNAPVDATATLTDENGLANTHRDVKVAVKTDNSGYENTSLPTTSNINLYRDGYNFIGWNTKADGTGTTYGNGRTFTSDELKTLLGDNESVTLYAQWEKKTIYIAGDSIYNAMKGNSAEGTKGLEELMTYNTWVAINKLGKENTYGVYPDGGGSVYNGGLFRTETTNINSSVTSSKSTNFNIFLDLGSDLMYNNDAKSGGYGLFKYTWDIGDILNYNSTLASIVAKKIRLSQTIPA